MISVSGCILKHTYIPAGLGVGKFKLNRRNQGVNYQKYLSTNKIVLINGQIVFSFICK